MGGGDIQLIILSHWCSPFSWHLHLSTYLSTQEPCICFMLLTSCLDTDTAGKRINGTQISNCQSGKNRKVPRERDFSKARVGEEAFGDESGRERGSLALKEDKLLLLCEEPSGIVVRTETQINLHNSFLINYLLLSQSTWALPYSPLTPGTPNQLYHPRLPHLPIPALWWPPS